LFNLFLNNYFPPGFSVIIADRIDIQIERLRKSLHEAVNKNLRNGKVSVHSWNQFALRIQYLKGNLADPEIYVSIGKLCKNHEREWGHTTNSIFYLAIPPGLFANAAAYLDESAVLSDIHRSRVVVEKPMGSDVLSIMEMNRVLGEHIREQQLFRIEHQMWKEIFYNILALRFANPVFETLWNRGQIEYIAITDAENSGINSSGNYYDQLGALRDRVPGYLLQLLSLIIMEPITSMESNEIRNKMVDALHNVQPFSVENVDNFAVRGQYERGRMAGRDVPGYRDELGVIPDSNTETFVALKFFVDHLRWHEVPFYIRTGKRLARQVSEIVIQFKALPQRAFPAETLADWLPARLVLSINPEPGISLRFLVKQPGLKFQLKPVDMRFNYRDIFSMSMSDDYESLLWDVLKNDPTLFLRSDQIESAWRIISPIQQVWSKSRERVPLYSIGSWGPKNVQKLFVKKDYEWPEPIILADYYQRIYKS
jgi:glucose-6-phosphate 1-dehydrogenase